MKPSRQNFTAKKRRSKVARRGTSDPTILRTDYQIKRLARFIARDLFTDGRGIRFGRLVLERNGEYIRAPGWSERAASQWIEKALSQYVYSPSSSRNFAFSLLRGKSSRESR